MVMIMKFNLNKFDFCGNVKTLNYTCVFNKQYKNCLHNRIQG